MMIELLGALGISFMALAGSPTPTYSGDDPIEKHKNAVSRAALDQLLPTRKMINRIDKLILLNKCAVGRNWKKGYSYALDDKERFSINRIQFHFKSADYKALQPSTIVSFK